MFTLGRSYEVRHTSGEKDEVTGEASEASEAGTEVAPIPNRIAI